MPLFDLLSRNHTDPQDPSPAATSAFKAEPAKTASATPEIPDCPYCGAAVPYLLESAAPCCRQYVATWFACNGAY